MNHQIVLNEIAERFPNEELTTTSHNLKCLARYSKATQRAYIAKAIRWALEGNDQRFLMVGFKRFMAEVH